MSCSYFPILNKKNMLKFIRLYDSMARNPEMQGSNPGSGSGFYLETLFIYDRSYYFLQEKLIFPKIISQILDHHFLNIYIYVSFSIEYFIFIKFIFLWLWYLVASITLAFFWSTYWDIYENIYHVVCISKMNLLS